MSYLVRVIRFSAYPFQVRLTSKRLEIQKRLSGDSPYAQPMSHMEGLFPSTAEIFC